ncbi:hypothetical protein BH11PSE10_BH11PSE10_02340 [soil metagenome]
MTLERVGNLWAPWLLLVVLLIGARPLYLLLGPNGVPVTVERKTWRYEIDVERRLPETGSDWCDALPPGAVELDRRLATDPQGHRAGTAAMRCRYSLPGWRRLYRAKAEGDASQAPAWPEPDLQHMPGIAADALRLGQRQAFFELQLLATDGKRWTCALPRQHWQRLPMGFEFRLAVDRFGTADCGKLPPS